MRTIVFLLQKEFKQIFRNKALLAMMLVAPSMQLLILPLAANYEVKNIQISVVDLDHSSFSNRLIQKIISSGYFHLVSVYSNYDASLADLESDRADLILQIPAHAERVQVRENNLNLFVSVNAINGVKANIGASYLQQIVQQYALNIRTDWIQLAKIPDQEQIQITSSLQFNPNMNYRFFMVPGILALLVTLVGVYLSALNIVKEKELGTIEQINVTPIKKHHFILGKLIPFWIIGLFVFSFGLWVIARQVYGIIPLGSIPLLYAFLAIYLLAVLGMGLLVSTYSETQMQAMSLAFFFMMIFMLMSGLFTPIDSMPSWAIWITRFNPVSYLIEVIRMIILKGSAWKELRFHFLKLIAFAAFFNTWAILNYRKRS